MNTTATTQEYRIGCGLELLDDLDKDSVTLVILDLPYFKVVKDEWDNQWRTLDDYLDWCKEWFIKSERVLKDNGSLYYFNSQFKVVKAVDTLIESCTALNFRQHVTIDKGWQAACSYHGVYDGIRSYPPGSEFMNWYTFQDESGLASIYSNIDCFKSIKEYMTSEYTKTGLSYGEINKLLEVSTNGGGMACHFFSIGNKIWMLPVEKMYEKLQTTGFFGREYEDLRREYEDLRYTFNHQNNSYDVWHFNFYKERRHGHPTQKPFDLIKRIVLTSSNAGDLVCDPAMGTGTTMKVCEVHDRNFRGAEIAEEYEAAIKARGMTHTPPLHTYFGDPSP